LRIESTYVFSVLISSPRSSPRFALSSADCARRRGRNGCQRPRSSQPRESARRRRAATAPRQAAMQRVTPRGAHTSPFSSPAAASRSASEPC
jgi:hypothetical protein